MTCWFVFALALLLGACESQGDVLEPEPAEQAPPTRPRRRPGSALPSTPTPRPKRRPGQPKPPPPPPPPDESAVDGEKAAALAAARAAVKAMGGSVQITKLAGQVAANIQARRYSYDRALLKRFQAAAGLVSDGVYGGATAGALRHYLGKAPPKPLFRPTTERSFP